MLLKNGTLLQGGKYKIEKVLGQGGFGITYLATQINLNRKVAIKEFFMKDMGAGGILRGLPPPLTKYLSTTEHEERQIADSMHLCPQPLYL